MTNRVTTNLKTREDPDTIKRAEVLNRGTPLLVQRPGIQ